MDDINLIRQNLEISTLEELLRQARNREASPEMQHVLAVSPFTEHVELDRVFHRKSEATKLFMGYEQFILQRQNGGRQANGRQTNGSSCRKFSTRTVSVN